MSTTGYILNGYGEIEKLSYKEYLREFGADETTTPRGVAPRLYIDGSTIYSWGVRGNNHYTYEVCNSNREAKKLLYSIWERNVENNWDAPRFFDTKKELYEDLADIHQKDIKVIKRYFSIKQAVEQAQIQAKKKHDNRPLTTEEDMINYINNNKAI